MNTTDFEILERDEPHLKGCIFWPITLIAAVLIAILLAVAFSCTSSKEVHSNFRHDKVNNSIRK